MFYVTFSFVYPIQTPFYNEESEEVQPGV